MTAFSAFRYPAAALVCETTPCRPVSPARWFFRGLCVMKRCKCVPCQGWSDFPPSARSELLPSLRSSSIGLWRPLFDAVMASTAPRTFLSCFSLSFRRLVSLRIAVIESTGLMILSPLLSLRCLAAFFRRRYSAWCRCAVNWRAVERNSSSTII